MEDYYRRHQIPAFEWKELGKAVPIDEKGFRLGYAQAIFTNENPVSVIIEELDDGSIRVDWESSVRYGHRVIPNFVVIDPSSPTLMRVIASRPTGEESDPYTSLERLTISDPGDTGTLIAGFNRDDPQFAPLLSQLESGNWQNVPLTLLLTFRNVADSRTPVEIAGIEGNGWLILQKQ